MNCFSKIYFLLIVVVFSSCQQVVNEIKVNKITALMAEGKYNKALELCNTEINRKPNEVINYDLRATIYQQIGKHEEAILDFNTSYLLDSINFIYLARASSFSELGNYQKALSDINKYAELKGESPAIYIAIANIFFAKEEYEKAIDKCTKGLKKFPNNSGLYNFRGYTKIELANYQSAITDFDMAIELDEYSEIAFNNRGFCKYELGYYDLAKEDVLISLDLNSGNSLAFRNIGLIQIKLGNNEEGCAALHRAIELGYVELYGVDINVDIVIYCNENK